MLKKLIIFGSVFLLTVHCMAQGEFPFRNPELPRVERINDLLGRLTLREKINLLIATSEAIPRLNIDKYQNCFDCVRS